MDIYDLELEHAGMSLQKRISKLLEAGFLIIEEAYHRYYYNNFELGARDNTACSLFENVVDTLDRFKKHLEEEQEKKNR